MWWLILILIVLLILSYLLFAPFVLEIDSNKGLYSIRFHRIISANLALEQETIFIKIKFAWWRKEINLLEPTTKKPEQIIQTKHRNKSRKKLSFKKMAGILKSFRIRKFLISVDTDNMQVNGIMYPICLLAQNISGRQIGINFVGENIIILKIENNIARIVWAFIKK